MKIICIGRNYADHAKELGNEVPAAPLIFMKPPSALLVNNKPFYIPSFTQQVHHEVELVVRICKNGRHVAPAFAHRYYDEVALGVDFTARDVQLQLKEKGHPWEIAKGFDGSAVISSFVSYEERWREQGIGFALEKNGQEVQTGHTRQMIHSIEDIIVYVSKYFKLQMGDYIYTGTPSGVSAVSAGDRLVGRLDGQTMFDFRVL